MGWTRPWKDYYFCVMIHIMQEELILVGQFKDEFSLTLGIGKDFPNLDIYRSKGLPTHL